MRVSFAVLCFVETLLCSSPLTNTTLFAVAKKDRVFSLQLFNLINNRMPAMAKEVDGIYNTVYLKWAVLMLHFMLPDMPIDVLRDMSSALLYRLSSWDKMGSIDEFELADVTRKFKDYNLPSSVLSELRILANNYQVGAENDIKAMTALTGSDLRAKWFMRYVHGGIDGYGSTSPDPVVSI